MGLSADPAQHDYQLGLQAEQHKQYDQAFAYFRQALELHPRKIRYILAFQRSRFEAALAHLHQGDTLRQAHHYNRALAQYHQALRIDPSNFVAAREYRQLRRQLLPAAAQPVTAQQQNAIARRLALAAGPEELGPVSASPITLRLNADSRIAYQTLARLAKPALNVLFDRNYSPAPVSLNLRQVSLLEALRIIGLESHSFYTVVTPNTIYVASDNVANRQRLQQQVVKTFYLHNLTVPADITMLGQTLRSLLGITHLQAIPGQMAIVMRDTPDRVAVAQQIIDSLDQPPPEVLVDVRVLEVSRDFIRDLGIQPPTSVTVGLQSANANTSSSSSTGTSTTSGTSSSAPLTFNDLRHLAGRNYSISIGQATLNMLLSDSHTHTLQEPQLRAIQGVKASEKIGERIPVATGSFQPGIGGVGINPLVNTQFNYQSVGVNMSMTPFIHPNNDITLKTHVEISSVLSYTNIGGISEPIIGQRIYQSTIDLKNGESNVLSGILTTQNIKNLNGIPGLGQIPLLKYLFSTTHIEHQRDEILIVMTPHIIRPWEISRQAARVIDTGTQNNVYLHVLPASSMTMTPPGTPGSRVAVPLPNGQLPPNTPPSGAVPHAPPSTAPAQPPAQSNAAHLILPQAEAQPPSTPAKPNLQASAQSAPRMPATGPSTPAPAPMPAASPANPAAQNTGQAALAVLPRYISTAAGQTFPMQIELQHAPPLFSLSFELHYNPSLFSVVRVQNGNFFSRDGRQVALAHQTAAGLGSMFVSLSRPDGSGGLGGDGAAVTVMLRAKAAGSAQITLSHAVARNAQGIPVALHLSQATVSSR